jgi:hypothetical protein
VRQKDFASNRSFHTTLRHRSIPAPTFLYRFDGEAGQDMLYLNRAFSSCSVASVIGENRVSVA